VSDGTEQSHAPHPDRRSTRLLDTRNQLKDNDNDDVPQIQGRPEQVDRQQSRIEVDRLRRAMAAVPMLRAADGRLVLAVDITSWLRPEAHTSPQRILCHTYGRAKDQHLMIPGWPYSVVSALETGRSSWTAPLDAVRLAPGDDAATVTGDQLPP